MPATARLRRVEGRTAAWIRSAPGTYAYLFALLVTSWSLRGADPRLADALIRSQSTNLDNLTDRPLQVLVASAFWTSGTAIPWQLLVRFTLVMAPVERRLGTRRTLVVFATGHVLATMLVAAGLSYGVRHGLADPDLAHASDVGVSYGLMAVAGALTWLLVPRGWRPVWVLALFLSISAAAATGGISFTDVGHLLSLVIGLAFAPLVRRWQRAPSRAILAGESIAFPLVALRSRARRGAPRVAAVTRVPAAPASAGTAPPPRGPGFGSSETGSAPT